MGKESEGNKRHQGKLNSLFICILISSFCIFRDLVTNYYNINFVVSHTHGFCFNSTTHGTHVEHPNH